MRFHHSEISPCGRNDNGGGKKTVRGKVHFYLVQFIALICRHVGMIVGGEVHFNWKHDLDWQLYFPNFCHLDRRERSQYAGDYHFYKRIGAVDGDWEVNNFK